MRIAIMVPKYKLLIINDNYDLKELGAVSNMNGSDQAYKNGEP